ncbi:hypoxanthine phosphoribosyltransferase [Candidatus Woesearchaeota archaeon]|nr:hypoxanthine phosphoribosyltransferase [Candidatus Woesearchaeota archaeon]MBT5396875.1 hypoxanthine phosphoribosyltransferase [Candidatus Woesearchaeota archaeon]MBT5924871.1 hypoxanthine phosphoribosyltransferase [Candidatus Woesearchaeota archaeon]MBT6367605.1 hypoxanthine phosphoribosyltransferase [Candidatus Woesearchaeota archaeon]MBT7762373.1 hypoxanthine phosphoribosyltransferase [Candidatus Woesearchaeota archaeon]
MDKHFVTAQSLLDDSYLLAHTIIESDFRPDFLVAPWRGGTPIGIAVHEYFEMCGLTLDHNPIKTSKYDNGCIDQPHKSVSVFGLEYFVEKADEDDKVLLIDDIFDTGLSMQEILHQWKIIADKSGRSVPNDIRIATVYYKPSRNETDPRILPDYHVHKEEGWIVFPHELGGLKPDEIIMAKGNYIAKLLEIDTKRVTRK